MTESLFIVSVLLIVYTYAGYPIFLKLLPRRPFTPGDRFTPPVTIVLSVFRGVDVIEKKLRNTFATDYPQDRLELIVICDGSDDGTDKKVASFGDPRVKLIRQNPRQGKTAAQKKAVVSASHDLLIFTDLTTMLDPDSIPHLVAPLADPAIGLVSSEDIWVTADGASSQSGQGAYVKYEMWLRDRESAVNSIVSASGCFYAVRREFFEPIPDYLIDDTVIPMTVVQHGSRCIHEKRAVSYVPMIPSADREFPRRARMALGGINALMYKARLLNPLAYGLYALQLWSHKLLRWLVPVFMLVAFLANAQLAALSPAWGLLFFAQGCFYLSALYGYSRRESDNQPKIVKLIYFFVSSNLALLYAWWQFFTHRRQTTWTESRG